MTQKDKVKELVGRGLDSYHTKSLQQIGRIEKKNKEQSHKISILTNELDNDYLTKTEEGSVISLDYSKEGMVYLDELQGNTLVNYCVDGAKELTLNGGIDVEGTNVTLTDTVDNGLVDVMCEGNTLVNAILENTQTVSLPQFISKDKLNIKPNTTYTVLSSSSKLVADFEEFQPIQDGLLCWVDGKDLDTSTNIWKDRSLNNNNIILNNIRLNGDSSCSGIDSSSYAKLDITIPPSYTIETVFTYTDITKIGALWYMGESSNSSHKYDYFWNYSDNGGSLSYRRKNASDSWITHDSLFFLKKDEVYRSVITYDDATKMARLYINGTFIKEVNIPNYEYYNTNTVLLMNSSTVSGERTLSNGKIFSFMMYDRVLTEGEISYNDSYKQAKLSNESRIIKNVVTTPNNIANVGLRLNGSNIVKDVILLEGDWTNKEVPSYFEGMKSVGECEDNKIEILSRNKNLFSSEMVLGSLDVNTGLETNTIETQIRTKDFTRVKPNTTYSVSCDLCPSGLVIHQYDKDYKHLKSDVVSKTVFITDTNCEYVKFRSFNADGKIVNENAKLLLEEGNIPTDYIAHKFNKKEISLNEPLRSINSKKDKIVNIGGKFFVKRETGEVVLSGEDVDSIYTSDINIDRVILNMTNFKNLIPSEWGASLPPLAKFETITWKPHQDDIGNHWTWFHSSQQKFHIVCPKGTTKEQAIEKLNGCKVVYEFTTPVYEPLEVEPTLNTYTDITHISNNSTIPCTMKIKNSGYNTIIKPSTQYTIVLDTNKSGTIGLNLGGAKVTTTNNVATITTPSTLTDDSLRLYGKGIKASKVRLLEGDKTNYIPSFFEGMKSSFEDKLQEDGTFKMEILSNNGNLINLEEQVRLNNKSGMSCSLKEYNGTMSWEIYTQSYIEYYNYLRCQYKPNTQYTMYFDCNMTPHDDRATFAIKVMYENSHTETFSMNKDTKNVQFTTLENRTVKKIYFSNWQYSGRVNIYNMKFCEGSDVLVEEKSNKIQFSSIEPLRGIGDVKDKFVFKDGKLMIERNTIKIVLNGSERWGEYDRQLNRPLKSKCYYMVGYDKFDISDNNSVCDIFSNVKHCYDSADINCFSDYHTAPNKYFTSFCNTLEEFKEYLKNNNATLVGKIKEPTYEEIPFELQKIILEGYENGTLFIDTNIPPTVTTTYSGETPIVKATRLNKTEVLNNTNDINDNIVPYLMDMDYRVVCLQLEGGIENVSMARLFGGTFEMLQRDILSNRYSKEEYKYRLDAYLSANKITENEYEKLGDMLNE